MHLARMAVTISALLFGPGARAEPFSPQGIWAVGGPSACGTDVVFLHARNGAWEFTDMTGQTRAQRVVSAAGADYVTRSASGAGWSYHFDSPSSARVTELEQQRSFRLVRCGADVLTGLRPAGS